MDNEIKLPLMRSIVVDRMVKIHEQVVDMKYVVGVTKIGGLTLRKIEPDYETFSIFGVMFLNLYFGKKGEPMKTVKTVNLKYVKEYEREI